MTQEQLEKYAEAYAYDSSEGILHTWEEYQEISKHFLAGVNWTLREFEELTKDKPRISLNTFLFILNQDEDCRVIITDFNQCFGHTLFEGWKSTLRNGGTTGFNYPHDYSYYKDWYVQDFILILGGLEITIVKSEEELD